MNNANNLLQGFQAGTAIGGGLRGAFKDKPAMQEAMSQIAQGADPTQVLQALSAKNPQAAQMLSQQLQSQYQVQAAPLQIEAQGLQNQSTQAEIEAANERRRIIGDMAGDDPVMQLFAHDPTTAGLLTRYISEKDKDTRIRSGAPILGALSVQNPQAKRRLINEAADEIDKYSPALAGGVRDILELPDEQLDNAIAPVAQIMGQMGFLPQDPRAQEPRTAQEKNFERYVELLETDPEKAQRFANAANLNPSERVKLAVEETRGKEEAKGEVGRMGEAAEKGLRNVDTIGGINRSLDLMQQVSTGGYANAKRAVTDFLGTTPADEAEFAYLTGKNVLGQLKDTFGAQFTEREGALLQRLEAGIGRSVEANMAILKRARQTAINAALRGLRAAEQAGDQFTYNEIKRKLDQLGIDVQGEVKPLPEGNGSRDFESEYGVR